MVELHSFCNHCTISLLSEETRTALALAFDSNVIKPLAEHQRNGESR
jgi:hypothetical protein